MDPNDNPFWLLDVSLDDDMETVDERVEELEDDAPDVDWKRIAQRLRKPQERVRCEVAWLPGIDSSVAQQRVAAALTGECVARGRRNAALADTNLRVMRLAASRKGRDDLTEQLLDIAECWDRVDAVAATQQINAHRDRAGMRAMATEERVRTALNEQQAYMSQSVVDELNRLSAGKMIDAIQEVCEVATSKGTKRAEGGAGMGSGLRTTLRSVFQ